LSPTDHTVSRASTTASVLSALDNKLGQIASYGAAISAENEDHDRVYNSILKDVSDRQKDTKKRGPLTATGNVMRSGGISELQDAMDVDEEPRMKGRKLVVSSYVSLTLQRVLMDSSQEYADGSSNEAAEKAKPILILSWDISCACIPLVPFASIHTVLLNSFVTCDHIMDRPCR
jgi:hypothetical protein